jgi:hypothetical protein
LDYITRIIVLSRAALLDASSFETGCFAALLRMRLEFE